MIPLGSARRLWSLGGVIKVNRHSKDFFSQLLRFQKSPPFGVSYSLPSGKLT